MEQKSYTWLDTVAAWLGVFDADWEHEFADDGYTDYFGLAPLNEPLFYSDVTEALDYGVVPVPTHAGRAQ